MDDTAPCLSPDGKRILFWRRDRQDLIGRTWLCSILPDGKDLRVLKRAGTADLGSPRDAFGEEEFPGTERIPGIPSPEGGTSVPQNIAQLQDGSYVFGYYGEQSLMGMADKRGRPIGRFRAYKIVRAKKMWATLSASSQWQDNPEATKAFWFGPGRKRLLLQRVLRNGDEGFPHLFFIDINSGRIRRRLDGHFLDDVDSKRADFLTTTLRRGAGAVPLQSLFLWKAGRRAQAIGPRNASYFGACFIRTRKPLPARPNGKLEIPTSRPKAARQDIVFSASVYREKLGNVYESETAHLYRIRPDGGGLSPLTRGNSYDSMPSLAPDGKHILFWRSPAPWGGPYRLYSISTNGANLRALNVVVHQEPSPNLAWAMIRSKPGKVLGSTAERPSITISDARGKTLSSGKPTFFSPDGKRVIVRGEYQGAVIDLKTGTSKSLDSHWLAPAWIDDHTIVAFRSGKAQRKHAVSGEIAYLDLKGRPIKRTPAVFSLDPSVLPEMFSVDGKAFPLDHRSRFLWEAHHPMSDGGYKFIHLVDAHQGTIRFLANQSLEAVAPNGRTFIGTEYAWVGGYKGPGSAKLGTMYLWDAKTLNRKPFGFRRMICNGACFVPAR